MKIIRRGRQFWRVLPMAAWLVACDASPESAKPAAALEWRSLQDRSHFARAETKDGPALLRCWPTGQRFACLSYEGGALPSAVLTSEPRLPERPPAPSSGYFCEPRPSDGGFTELIRNATGEKVASEIYVAMFEGEPVNEPWSRTKVERYLADNRILPAARYFDCRHLFQTLASGSAASIGTTSLSLRDLSD